MPRRPRTTLLVAVLLTLATALAGLFGTAAADASSAAVPIPPTPVSSQPIEPLATYVGQTACDPKLRPGTAELANLLVRTYRSYGATGWASTYPCGTDGSQSEHYDLTWLKLVRTWSVR